MILEKFRDRFFISVAVSKNLVIGSNSNIPWKIRKDLEYFKQLTDGHIILMGRKTYESLPRRLSNRYHVVLSSQQHDSQLSPTSDVFFSDNLDDCLAKVYNMMELSADKKCFIIGGSSLFQQFSPHVSKLYVTHVDKYIKGDTYFFPSENLSMVEMKERFWDDHEKCYVTMLEYVWNKEQTNSHDAEYVRMLQDIIKNGKLRSDRTGTGTKGVFGRQLRFDLKDSIPILSTKLTAWKACLKELLWFMRGDTNAKHLQEQGVHIWDGNTSRKFLDQRGLHHMPEGDIGAGYGFQWRHFGSEYKTCNDTYHNQGIDQLQQVINALKSDPFSRRHVVSAWNPTALPNMALPPCHIMFQFYVSEDDNGQKWLSTHMYQRSVDCFLGLPFNILSYSLLTHMIAKMTDMLPNELVISTGDTHIYNDHLSQVMEQIDRVPLAPAKVLLSDTLRMKTINEIVEEDVEIIGYFHHPALKGKMSV